MDGAFGQIIFYAGPSYDEVLILDTGMTVAVDRSPIELTLSLAQLDNAIYDVISGEILFNNVDRSFACGDSIYVLEEGADTYTRYIVSYA